MSRSDFEREREIIKDLKYDSYSGNTKGFTNEDKSVILKTTPFSDGTGVKYDLYENVKNGDLNKPHSATHMKVNNDETWTKETHNEDKTETTSESGTGCYLTTACLQHYKEKFNDNCEELKILRWFRDNFVLKEDIMHYYEIAPTIVEAINRFDNNEKIYKYIYEKIICICVEAIKNGEYVRAYNTYSNSILIFEKTFARPFLGEKIINIIKTKI